jgi:O-antigen ligase
LTLYYKLLYSVVEIFLYTLYLGFLYSCCSYFEYSIYELYIELDFKDSIYFISNEVVTILTIGHLFILLILGYNRESIYTSKYN